MRFCGRLHDKGWKGLIDISTLFQDIAEIFRGQVREPFVLDYSEESLKEVDRMLSMITEPGQAPDDTLVLSAGAYLGETTIRLLGGEWRLDETELTDSSVLVEGCELWPFRRVRQRIYYGTQNPLYAWFEMARAGAAQEVKKLLQGQEQATLIRPTGHDPLVIKITKSPRNR
ncbi:hypothetical protein CIG75_16060 [Tumebacillus algifaecis]|uniref:Uncharacterized protein n=1 Tax=Tumebacillus algifaecis TaxID=1214604 RepID=A0A223D450_9BACL|nr:hypothetical protein [Tumebacillus algifaecis]ASS76310.1 hypothetical protein CIG75_16060 [Tumebacillus algifaecis]